MTHTKRTTTKLSTTRTRDVVLEKARSPIVREAFAELDNRNKESSLGERLADLAECAEFFSSGFHTTEAVFFLDNHVDRGAGAVAVGGLLTIDMDVCADIVVVDGCAEQVRLLIGLGLHVLQLFSPGGGVNFIDIQ